MKNTSKTYIQNKIISIHKRTYSYMKYVYDTQGVTGEEEYKRTYITISILKVTIDINWYKRISKKIYTEDEYLLNNGNVETLPIEQIVFKEKLDDK